MESSETTFIYGLWDPRTLELRYIGKADNPEKRWFSHLSYARHGDGTYKSKWIRQLLEEGLLPCLDVLEEVPGDRWQEYEMAWIEEAREQGLNLTNTSDGGNGFTKGYKFPDEVRKRIGEKNRGKVMSPEARRKIGDGNRGKVRSPEFLQRLSEYRKGKRLSEEHKRKIAEAGRGRTHTEETREKLRKNIYTNGMLSRESVEKSAKSRMGLKHSEEHKRKISEGNKKNWEKRKAASHVISDETRRKMSESAKNRNKIANDN